MTEEVLRRAYRYCGWITTRHYENFPVASWLLPQSVRPHVAAVYAFARSADDFADEARYHGRSLELLDQWRSMLWNTARSSTGSGRAGNGAVRAELVEARTVDHPIFLALADTVRRHDLPVQLLDDLLTAFTMDVTKRRYNDWPDLMNYCRHSANPVGRLVLFLSGIRDEELHARSDDICSGLQLANHWQDLNVDLARDILYIPQDLLRKHGVTESSLKARLSAAGDAGGRVAGRRAGGRVATGGESRPDRVAEGHETRRRARTAAKRGPDGRREYLQAAGPAAEEDSFRDLMKELVKRTRALFDSGEPLVKHLKGGLRLEIKLTLLGGRTILDRIEAADYDVFNRRPVVSTADKLCLLTRALLS